MPHRTMVLFLLVFTLSPAWAQGRQAEPHAGHSQPLSPTDSAETETGKQEAPVMEMGPMQGGSPPPDARDPHAYAEGYDLGPLQSHLPAEHSLGSLMVERLEAVRSGDNTSTHYDLQAWYGRAYDRAVLKTEGEIAGGDLAEARTELLWSHAVAAYWDAQLGIRHDSGEGPDRSWFAFGIQGLTPYWFEVEAAGYLGDEGRSALRLDISYELLFTQRLILQPRIETAFFGTDDDERGLGSGLSELTAALRLRYEIRRECAPYLGVEWARKFGETKDLARAAGDDPTETRLVAGVRFWF